MNNAEKPSRYFKPFKYIKKFNVLCIIYFIVSMSTVFMTLYIPQYINNVLNFALNHNNVNFLSSKIVINFLCLISVEFVLIWMTNYLNIYLSNKIAFMIGRDTLNHIKRAQYSYTAKYNDAYLAQKINNDSVCLGDFIIEKLPVAMSDLIIIISITIISFYINWIVGTLLLFSLILYFMSYYIPRKTYYRRNKTMLESQAEFFAMLSNQIFNLLTIKINVFYDATDSEFLKTVASFFQKSIRFLKVDFSITTIAQLLTRLSYGMAILIIYTLSEGIEIGNIAVIILYVQVLLSSAQRITQFGKYYESYKVSRDRIDGILEIPLDKLGNVEIESVKELKTNALSFSYGDRILFADLSVTLSLGNIYVIRGANGSGKTTFINLLLGILPYDNGSIYINSLELSEIDIEYFREHHVSYTEQVPCIYNGSIADNLFYNTTRKISNEELLTKFPLLKFVNNIEDGLDNITHGRKSSLSGGEKQKIAICRTLIKNSDILIFDEPTSSLDEQSINILMETLAVNKRDHITIIISHDERVFQYADDIINF